MRKFVFAKAVKYSSFSCIIFITTFLRVNEKFLKGMQRFCERMQMYCVCNTFKITQILTQKYRIFFSPILHFSSVAMSLSGAPYHFAKPDIVFT